MKRKLSIIVLVFVLALCSFGLVACGNSGGGAGENPPADETPLGVTYVLSEDGTYYACSGTSDEDATDIVIESTYEGLPVKEIQGFAFFGNDVIENITIPNSIVKIDNKAFENCWNIEKTNYLGTIDEWVTIEFVDYASNPLRAGGELYINDTLVTDVNIANATTISNFAFARCSSITTVTMTGVEKIGDDAFNWCPNLTSVVMGEGLRTIGDGAFSSCELLASAPVPSSVARVGLNAFAGCNSEIYTEEGDLTYVGNATNPYLVLIDGKYASTCVPHEDTKVIADSALKSALALTKVVLPSGLLYIGESAFYSCDRLVELTIPASVIGIRSGAFSSCGSLDDITYQGTRGEWNSINLDGQVYYGFVIHCTDGDIDLLED